MRVKIYTEFHRGITELHRENFKTLWLSVVLRVSLCN
jgi:hypothetical protein